MRSIFPALALLLAFAPASAQSPDAAACPVGARGMTRLELLFGARKLSGGDVSRVEWEAFVDSEITPRFPDGLTWFEGFGQWRGADRVIVRETTRMLVVWAEPGEAAEIAIEAVRAAYRARFDQESVLRAHGWSCVRF